jgi:type IV pilus assembly protein PilB
MKKGPSEQDDKKQSTLLGQILVELGYITVYQLDEALQIQKESDAKGDEHQPLGSILLELGYCSPNQLIRGIQVQVEYRKASAPKS